MAATRFISMHKSKGKTPAVSLSERVAYILNPTKTDGGRLVSAHGCDPATAAAEMLLTRRQYLDAGGWVPGNDKEVLAYHIRQAFKPGEITPEDANRIGRELAERFTKGRYQFIVATHIDRGHVHNHIIFAAVSEDAGRRFRDFLGTAKAVRKISDRLCLENGLSVIENPKRGRKDYGKWLGDQRPLSAQEKVRDAIDAALAQRRGSSLSFLAPGQEKATRCRKKTLGDDYTPEAIQERIEGRRVVSSSRSKAPAKPARKVNLLIDIQSKLQAGKGAGYAQWAKVFNLKQMAQTISFLEENGLLEYDALAARAAEAAFDKLCLQKLPTYKTLQAEYAGLLAEKKKAYAEYAAAKKEMQAVLTAKANVDRLLGAPPERPEQEKEQAQR